MTDQRDTILIVDDMEVNRVILSGAFEKDYNLLEAENGEQAMLLIQQYHGKLAAILAYMPKMWVGDPAWMRIASLSGMPTSAAMSLPISSPRAFRPW